MRPNPPCCLFTAVTCPAGLLFCCLDSGRVFIAALPTLDIAEGALDKLFAIYKELLPHMGGYLTHAGQLHRGRLEMILHRLAALEQDTLEQRAQVCAQLPTMSPCECQHRFANPQRSWCF